MPDYVAAVKHAFNERWIDLLPTEGKKSGAYSNGAAYDVHPYMLINFNGKYADVSTLAHELGHTLQSYFSNKTQPYPLANYPIFVAEVASTFNESLLIDSVLKTIKDDDTVSSAMHRRQSRVAVQTPSSRANATTSGVSRGRRSNPSCWRPPSSRV